jgi:hypothetical protein
MESLQPILKPIFQEKIIQNKEFWKFLIDYLIINEEEGITIGNEAGGLYKLKLTEEKSNATT